MGQHPTSVTRATQLLLGLLVAGLVVTVLVVVFRDDLDEAWSRRAPARQRDQAARLRAGGDHARTSWSRC